MISEKNKSSNFRASLLTNEIMNCWWFIFFSKFCYLNSNDEISFRSNYLEQKEKINVWVIV